MVKKRFLVPNLFTGMNFLLGIYAILIMAESLIPSKESLPILGSGKPPLVLAAWILMWCVLLDKLDGFAARLLKASSEFGAQFDSLADLTAFGIAPGFLVYFYMQAEDLVWFTAHRPMMLASVSVYMICTALRLARFNAIDSGELKGYFHGLPSTFAGGFVAVSVILHSKYGLTLEQFHGIPILPLILILAGLLMVSPLYLPKLVRRKNRTFNFIQICAVFVGYLCGFGMVFPELLFGLCLIYAGVGFIHGFVQKEKIEGMLVSKPDDE